MGTFLLILDRLLVVIFYEGHLAEFYNLGTLRTISKAQGYGLVNCHSPTRKMVR
jgi:hypothetical protein